MKEKLEELLRSATVLDTVPQELFDIHGEIQRIESLYRGEKNILRNLARRTKSEAGAMIRVLNEIIENGTTNVKIPYILGRVQKLLSYSDRTLDEADKKLAEIGLRYEEVATKLLKLEIKIKQGKEKVENYIKKLEAGIATTRAEKNDISDVLKQTMASVQIGSGITAAGLHINKWRNDGFDTEIGMKLANTVTSLGKPILTIVEEWLERDQENSLIELYQDTKSQVETLEQMYKEHIEDIRTTKSNVEKRKTELADRRRIITLWHDVVVEIIEHHEDGGWEELEEHMTEGNSFMLHEAIIDFQNLQDVAVQYIQYDKKVVDVPLPAMS